MAGSVEIPAKGGFSFDLCRRNAMLEKNGLKMPGFRKTGTTIVGLVFQVSCDLTFTVSTAFQGSDGAL
jgi:20S proteasome subunit beta 2